MTFTEQAQRYFKAADDLADSLYDDERVTGKQWLFAREAIKEALKEELVAAARGQWLHVREEIENAYTPFDEGHPYYEDDEVPF